MYLKDILKAVRASEISTSCSEVLDTEFNYAFASDLMSDCLAFLDEYNSSTILLTGLANAQSIRTCEMLDLPVIIYVRGKVLSNEDIEIVKERNLSVFTTNLTMFETCATLYNLGIKVPGT